MSKKILGFTSAFLLVVGAFFFAQAQSPSQGIPPLNDSQYMQAPAQDVFVMFVSQDGCRPCQMAERKVFLPLLNTYAANGRVHVVKVEVSEIGKFEKEQILNKFNVKRTPTALVVQNRQAVWKKEILSEEQAGLIFNEIVNTVNAI